MYPIPSISDSTTIYGLAVARGRYKPRGRVPAARAQFLVRTTDAVPAGVPVRIIIPGRKVKLTEKKCTRSAHVQITVGGGGLLTQTRR